MFSAVTSAFASISLTISRPFGDFRLIAIDFLLTLNWRKYQGSSSGLPGRSRRPGSPRPGFSILTTSAPNHASTSVQVVPASNCVKSTTLTPCRKLKSWLLSLTAVPPEYRINWRAACPFSPPAAMPRLRARGVGWAERSEAHAGRDRGASDWLRSRLSPSYALVERQFCWLGCRHDHDNAAEPARDGRNPAHIRRKGQGDNERKRFGRGAGRGSGLEHGAGQSGRAEAAGRGHRRKRDDVRGRFALRHRHPDAPAPRQRRGDLRPERRIHLQDRR